MPLRFIILLVGSWFLVSFSALTAPKPSAEQKKLTLVIDKLQSAWDKMRSFSSNYKQHIHSKKIGTHDENEGTVSVLKPDKLRWESKTEGSVQIIQGKKLTFVQTNKRRGTFTVDIYEDFTKRVDAKALQFLTGKVKFRDTYIISPIRLGDSSFSLKLVPKGNQEETYIAEFDGQSYLLLSLITETAETRARIDFLDAKVNPALDLKLFEYISKPTDVVQIQKE